MTARHSVSVCGQTVCRRWVTDTTKGVATDVQGRWKISRIWKWFAADFEASLCAGGEAEAEGEGGGKPKPKPKPNTVSFIRRYLSTDKGRCPAPALEYFDYDWGLNSNTTAAR